jgi:dihydrofolate reductase
VHQPVVSLIVAMANNGVIGKDNRLPWHLPEDLKRFKRLTMGHHIIMGRKTYESIGKLLPGRTSVIVTRRQDYLVPGAIIAHSLEEAIERCASDHEIFVIGGAEIYRAALSLADRLLITQIDREIAGDTLFPPVDWSRWREIERQPCLEANAQGLTAQFVVYAKVESAD